MKRLAWLLLAAILSFSTAAFAAPQSPQGSVSTTMFGPPARVDPEALAAGIPGYNVYCHDIRQTRLCASVSEARVTPGSYVTIYGLMKTEGVGVQGQIMKVTWSSKTTASCTGLTDETGLASCSTYVPANQPTGRKVYVKLWIDKYKLATSFMIPHPSQGSE